MANYSTDHAHEVGEVGEVEVTEEVGEAEDFEEAVQFQGKSLTCLKHK